MSLFWRIAIGFAAVVICALLGQRIVYTFFSKVPAVQSWTVSGSELVAREGDHALGALLSKDERGAMTELNVLNSTGMQSWLVTNDRIIGEGEPPVAALEKAKDVLSRQSSGGLFFRYRIVPVQSRGRHGVLLIVLPGLDSPIEVALRLGILIGIPLAFCLILAKRIANPVERIGTAAAMLASGDLGARVGKFSGPLELQRLGYIFNDLAEKLEEARLAQKRLLADISHEIRSPLGRLMMATEMLEKGTGKSSKYNDQIRRDVQRLNELVQSLAFVVHPTEMPIQLDTVDLLEICKSVVEATTIEAESKGIALELKGDIVEVQGNAGILFGAVENLVRNAILHSPVYEQIDIQVSNHPVQIQVSDRGPAVPEEALEHIFEPFYRHSDSRTRDSGGTGLGLAIVETAMNEHGGAASANLRIGGGLTVTLSFDMQG